MPPIVCETCGRKYRASALKGMEFKECICGRKIPIPENVATRIQNVLFLGLGMSVVFVLMPLLFLFSPRHWFTGRAFLSGGIGIMARAIIGFVIGIGLGIWKFNTGLKVLDWAAERPHEKSDNH